MRPFYICGNWKMQKSKDEMKQFFSSLTELKLSSKVRAAIAPVSLHLDTAIEVTKDAPVEVVAQNMHFAEKGAFTGEISPLQLQEIGCKTVILGHSERREYFNESNETVAAKVRTAIEQQMTAIVCIGESLEQREAGVTFQRLREQLIPVLKELKKENTSSVIIAYEPIWAIGTGKTASAEMAQEVHQFIRQLLTEHFGEHAEKMLLLYGGSVKPANAEELLSQKDIDGALVGGASLESESFTSLLNIAVKLSCLSE